MSVLARPETARSPVSSDGRLPLGALILAGGGIYAAQGLIGGLTFQGLPAVLRANDVPLGVIGLVFLTMIPWSIKFLWAPGIESWRNRVGTRGRTKRLILGGQIASAAILVMVAAIGFHPIWSLLGAFMLLALIAATVDIGCDGFMIEQLEPATRGWGSSAQIGGSYTGFLIGTGVFLWLNGHYGWQVAAPAMALCVLVLAVPFAVAPAPPPTAEVDGHRPSLRYSLRRREVLLGIAVMVLYDFGIRITSGLEGPFLVDRGMDLATIGVVTGFIGISAGIAGTFLGAVAVRRLGSPRAVVAAIVLQILAVGGFLVLSLNGDFATEYVVAVVLGKSVVMSVGFVSVYSLLMGFSSLRQAGVDFTIFQCIDAAIAAVAGFGAGVIAQTFGYAGAFGLAAALSALAFVVVAGFLFKQMNTLCGEAGA